MHSNGFQLECCYYIIKTSTNSQLVQDLSFRIAYTITKSSTRMSQCVEGIRFGKALRKRLLNSRRSKDIEFIDDTLLEVVVGLADEEEDKAAEDYTTQLVSDQRVGVSALEVNELSKEGGGIPTTAVHLLVVAS